MNPTYKICYKTISYNWWTYDPFITYDFGPQTREHFRLFDNNNFGRPITIGDTYHIMSNNETDYDQIYSASILQNDPTWIYPTQEQIENISDGHRSKSNVYSVGSFDIPSSDPTFSHHQWNLITRNTQLVVSGLYYWTVEFPDGETQIGKLVVLM